jgi:plastocyanin
MDTQQKQQEQGQKTRSHHLAQGIGKKTWLFISLGILVVLTLLTSSLLRTDTKPNNNYKKIAQDNKQQAKVTINSNGFNPTTIQVQAGTQVTWENLDTKPHRVAADPYPANNSIPGFNNDLELQLGNTYTFEFAKTGTYHVHDQLNPMIFKATIVVE